MEDSVYGPQVIAEIMQKPEFHFMNKYYSLLYQSLIPNCSLTIKALRQRHLVISDNVEQYILIGGSPRIRCQRLVNFLLVNLNDVKDYIQFCNYLDSVSVIGDLSVRLVAEFYANDKWRHVPHHSVLVPKPITPPKMPHILEFTCDFHSSDATGASCSLVREDDYWAPCIIADDGASVDKANKCSISSQHHRRKPFSGSLKVVSEQSDKTVDITSETEEKGSNILQKPHSPISLNLEFMIGSAEWNSVDKLFLPLCDSLSSDYRSTIEKLKTFPQFSDAEKLKQLNSLIPASLTDVQEINKRILTFVVMILCYDTSSGVITRLCGVMEQLMEFSESLSCVKEMRTGIKLLISRYPTILRCLPTDYEATINLFQRYLTDDQICQILGSANYAAANKIILDCLIEKLKESLNLSEFCEKLEILISLSSDPEQLGSIVKELRADLFKNDQDEQKQAPKFNDLSAAEEKLELPDILTKHEDFARLKRHYHTILTLMPEEYEHSVAKLQRYISDDQICTILSCGSHTAANKLILDYLIVKLTCKEDLLDLCDQLENISTSHHLQTIIQEIRSGVEQLPGVVGIDALLKSDLDADPFKMMYNMAFSDLQLNPDSKVIAVLKKNYDGLCNCLPKDSAVTIRRVMQHASRKVFEGVKLHLAALPDDHANAMIIVLLIKPISQDTDVLAFCDILEKVVDNSDSEEFVHKLRSEFIEVLSSINATQLTTVREDPAYFDRLIFSHMSMHPNSDVMVLLKKHCLRLSQCLPRDYRKTLNRIASYGMMVPPGMLQQLAMLPSPDLANHQIIAALLRPLTNEAGVLGFCDVMKLLADDKQSLAFVERFKSEIAEGLGPVLAYKVKSNKMQSLDSVPVTATAEQAPDHHSSVVPVAPPSPAGTDDTASQVGPTESLTTNTFTETGSTKT